MDELELKFTLALAGGELNYKLLKDLFEEFEKNPTKSKVLEICDAIEDVAGFMTEIADIFRMEAKNME